MTSAYERGTQAPMDITELGPRKPSVFDVPDLSMASVSYTHLTLPTNREV